MGRWEERNNRLLILGLGGDWYFKNQFLQDRVQEIHGEATKDLALWKIILLNTIIEFSSEFIKITKKLMKYFKMN